jgi:hypothetical protein
MALILHVNASIWRGLMSNGGHMICLTDSQLAPDDAPFISKTVILHRLMPRNVMAVTVIGLQITYFLGRSTNPPSAGRMDAKTRVDRCRGN